jgi:hypothetical protein
MNERKSTLFHRELYGAASAMTDNAISVDGVWKKFRLYHEKNQYLKSAIMRGRRSRHEDFWALGKEHPPQVSCRDSHPR